MLIGAVPPLMLKTAANPGGLPIEVFDGIRAGVASRPLAVLQGPQRRRSTAPTGPGAKVSQGVRDAFWLQGMLAGLKGAYDCIKAFSETDFTEDLKKFDVPTLIMHGDDDQIVPIGASALLAVQARQGRDAEGLSGRAARPVHHPRRPVQRRPAGIFEEVGLTAAWSSIERRRGTADAHHRVAGSAYDGGEAP